MIRRSSLTVEAVSLLEAQQNLETDLARIDAWFAAREAKIEMMAKATKDSHPRVVQINPLHSSATSREGHNDTTSSDKTLTTTVSAKFSLK